MNAQPTTDPIDLLAQRFEVLGRVLHALRRDGRCPWLEAQLAQVREALGSDAKIPHARRGQARLVVWAFEIAALSCCELARISPPPAMRPDPPSKTDRPATTSAVQRSQE